MDEMSGSALAVSNVRHPLWRGWQSVAAFWFPAQGVSVAQRDRRLLQAWATGSRAWRFADGDLLCLAQPLSLQCDSAPGLALCRIDGVLHAAPLTAGERRALPSADLVLVQGAQPQPRRLHEGEPLDLSSLLDFSTLALATVYPLRPPPLPAAVKLPGSDVRGLVGGKVGPRSAATESLMQVMRGEPAAPAEGPALRRAAWWGRDAVAGATVGLLGRLAGKLARASGGQPASGLQARHPPQRPSAWRRQLARLAMLTRISTALGHRQSAHLRRMMSMFERGDLDEGLRNALPLDLDASVPETGPAFGVPGRRDSLQVGARRGGRSSIALDDDLVQNLQRMYRAAFEQLDRRGRVDEALFVLAELLGARTEALDYLVRHGRAREAAELAVGWDLSAPVLIRLLLLAGDHQRAVLVARRDNAFAEAVVQLQHEHAALADRLRLEWARQRQQQGEWLEAVETAWPLPDAREEALGWLLDAERSGQLLSARALMLRTALLPATLVEHACRIEALVAADGDPSQRLAAADALLQMQQPTPAIRAMAGHLLPALAADRAANVADVPLERLKGLLKLSRNTVLSADVPDWSVAPQLASQPLAQRGEPLRLRMQLAGSSALALRDVVVLEGERCLVALGEAGVAMLDARGRVLQRHRSPASRLVLAQSGEVALAVAEREQVCHVARLDLVTGQSRELGSLVADAMSPVFDGTRWTVQSGRDIRLLDVCSSLHEVLWHVDLPAAPVAHGFFREREVWLVPEPGRVSPWAYSAERRRRIAQEPVPIQDVTELVACPRHGALQVQLAAGDGDSLQLLISSSSGGHACRLLDAGAAQVRAGGAMKMLDSGLLVTVRMADATHCFLVRVADGGLLAQVEWPPGVGVRAGEQGGRVWLHDPQGRLLQIDTGTSASTTRVLAVG